jgi:Flp pilus assembly protein protease CpaA
MIFLSIIFTIGVLTTFTDLKNKKIYNNHLLIGAGLGLIAIIYSAIFTHDKVIYHIVNGLIAFVVSVLLHRSALWRGGDAKLFTLYVFLMPPAFNLLFFPSVVSLFACSFIAGTIVLFPVFIRDILINRSAIVNDLLLPEKRRNLSQAILRIIFFSWILFPLYYLARITNPVIILTILYLIFCWKYDKVKTDSVLEFIKKNFIIFSVGILFGLLMRLWLSPNSLSYPALIKFILMLTLSTTLSTCIHTTFEHFKNYHDRVPFAPMLFAGCILSYTPFLTRLIKLMTQWNVLLSR